MTLTGYTFLNVIILAYLIKNRVSKKIMVFFNVFEIYNILMLIVLQKRHMEEDKIILLAFIICFALIIQVCVNIERTLMKQREKETLAKQLIETGEYEVYIDDVMVFPKTIKWDNKDYIIHIDEENKIIKMKHRI